MPRVSKLSSNPNTADSARPKPAEPTAKILSPSADTPETAPTPGADTLDAAPTGTRKGARDGRTADPEVTEIVDRSDALPDTQKTVGRTPPGSRELLTDRIVRDLPAPARRYKITHDGGDPKKALPALACA
jgi:hypothetical protein